MPDANPAAPKYRHYKPKDLAVVRIDGHDHYLGKFGSPESREKYWRLVSGRNLSGTTASPATSHSSAEPLSVAELILAFWRHGEMYYRRADGTPTGELENHRHSFRPLKALFGGTAARDFGPNGLKLVRQRMLDSGLSRGVINRRVQRIVHLFAFGVENELLPKDVHHALKAVKSLRKGRSGARESESVRPVPDHLVEAAKPFLSRQLRAVVDLQCLTGMRSSEALIMRTCDVDTSEEVWAYTPNRHKGEHLDKERRIFLGPRAREVVRPWLRADPAEYLFQPREAEANRRSEQRRARRSPLTPSQRSRQPKSRPKRAPGDRYDARGYSHAVTRACTQAFPHPTVAELRARLKVRGMPRHERGKVKDELETWTREHRDELEAWRREHHWHPHQLRHNAATWLRKEFGLDVARVILGHSSPAVTLIYAEADEAKARAVMSKAG